MSRSTPPPVWTIPAPPVPVGSLAR